MPSSSSSSSLRSFICGAGILIVLLVLQLNTVSSMLLSRSSFTKRTMSAAFTSLSTSSANTPLPPPPTAVPSDNTNTTSTAPSTSPSTSTKPSLKSYYQLTVDEKGETCVLQRDFKHVQEVGYSNTPQLLTQVPASFATPVNVIFTALQGENPWHHCPAPQIVVCLRGGWYVQTTDGNTVHLFAGDVLYQDNTADHPGARKRTQTGTTTIHAAMHYSGSLNIGDDDKDDKDEPCDQMIVQLKLKGELVANSKDVEPPF